MNNRQLRKHLFSKWPYKEDKDFKNQLRGRKPKWLIDGLGNEFKDYKDKLKRPDKKLDCKLYLCKKEEREKVLYEIYSNIVYYNLKVTNKMKSYAFEFCKYAKKQEWYNKVYGE